MSRTRSTPAYWLAAIALAAASCAPVPPRFPSDVKTALAHDNMRKLETERFIIYYPETRRALVDRFLVRADACAQTLNKLARIKSGKKFLIVLVEAPFNNAFVAPGLLGYEEVSVIPTFATLDFTTAFGLPPDPGAIACHELVHYVQFQHTDDFWRIFNKYAGPVYSPQLGYDAWVFEGIATYYESQLLPGMGRPAWPLFTGTFAAGYAGRRIDGGELSTNARRASVGHHYLVGSMFFRFLAERSGEKGLWAMLYKQASAVTGFFFTGTFSYGFGKSLGGLLDEFRGWVAKTFPVRLRPPTQRSLGVLGNEARYARGRDGTEAWVAVDVDSPPRLTVRDPRGGVLLETALVEVVPPRTLAINDPLLVSGLSITADGREVWLTAIDVGATFQTTRLLRWRRGERGLSEVARGLGPGATIDPAGGIYYYCEVDGDRWSLAAWDVRRETKRKLVDAKPGTYIVGAQSSRDGSQLAASVWDGTAFVVWVIDVRTGAILRRIDGSGTAVFDPSFTTDGRVMWLGVVDGRFQVFVDGTRVTDAPYAVLAAREANGTIRFLDREHWSWELGEVALPAPTPVEASPGKPGIVVAAPKAVPALGDESYSAFDHFFFPTLRTPAVVFADGAVQYGLALGGADRLELQRWSVGGSVQPPDGDRNARFGGTAGYYNGMLAPVSVIAQAGFLDWIKPIENPADPMLTIDEEHRTRDGVIAIGYTYRATLTGTLGVVYTDDRLERPGLVLHRYLGGPSASLEWFSAEGTRYTDVRRALLVDGQYAYYPHEFSSFRHRIQDVGTTVGLVVPVPIGRRHTVRVQGRMRRLIAEDEVGLLQVGGDAGIALLYERTSKKRAPNFDETRFAPNLRFVEPLRGFEDFAIASDRVEHGEISWRYPLIIDRGVASTWFLPTSFLRQIDFELFGTGALTDGDARHYAFGGALTVRLQLIRLPLLVRYQIARRLSDDRALTQFIGVGPDI